MHSSPTATHTPGRRQPVTDESPTDIDYTTLNEGVAVEGHMADGTPIESTARCPKCDRIGVVSLRHEGPRVIVHRGLVSGNRLEGIDYCKIEYDQLEP